MRLGLRGQIIEMDIHIIFYREKMWQEFTSYRVSMEKINVGSEGLDSLTSISLVTFIMCMLLYIIGQSYLIVNQDFRFIPHMIINPIREVRLFMSTKKGHF